MQRVIVGFILIASLSSPALPQDSTSSVSGTVFDGMTGAIIRGAQVELVGTGISARTDLDGRYVLTAPPGTYRILATLEGYFPNQLDALELSAGVERIVDLVLVEEEVVTQSITVTAATAESSTAEAIILERRSAPTVSDGISAQEISANSDSDAASAMSRVVGVSVLDDKYVYVRGLGDRFSTTQLNGSLLPSTEADRKVVPLDLFPANLVDNIKLEKTFTPDMPAEFSGALVSIETVEFPSTSTLNLSVSEGFNTLSTFKDFMSYPGGRYDWLGFGDDRRQIPEIIPDERLARSSRFSAFGFTPQELETFGESFENVWNPRTKQAIPNQSVSLLAGNTFGKLGLVYALSYGNKFQNRDIARNYYVVGLNNELEPIVTYDLKNSTNSVRLGNTLNFAYKLNDNHKILFKNFFSKDTSDEARTFEGFNNDFAENVFNQRLRFIEETIYSGQVSGEHYLPGLNGLFEWRVAYNKANREEPDIREALYLFNRATNTYRLREQTQSGLRQFIKSRDTIWEPGVDFTKFLSTGNVNGSIRFGGVWTQRDRFFDSRRFRFRHLNTTNLDLSLDPETLFTPEFIGPNFEIQEDTRTTDHYLGNQKIWAGYVMTDLVAGSRWRFIGGLRVENSDQALDSFDLFAVNPTVVQTRLDDTDYLPSVSLVYSLTPRQNIRGAFSQTLARPNFRELAPFDFTDVTGGTTVIGNPDLVRTQIDNYDLRWEYFLTATDLVSASFFYKDFKDPIEQILQPTAQIRQTFENVDRARNWGIELELRKSLGDVSGALENFSLAGNYTFVHSRVDIGQQQLSVVTSTERPLAGQSENVLNFTLEYANPRWWGHSSRLLYNMVGSRLTDVGALGLPDVYQENQHILDFILEQNFGDASPLRFKFSATNLLDDEKRFTQGGAPYMVYREGRTFSAGLSYRFF